MHKSQEELSMTKIVLLDQYYRCRRAIRAYEKAIKEECVQGYLSKKTIKGKTYYYLQKRDGKKVVSTYVKSEDVEQIKKKIALRKNYENHISKLKATMKDAEKFLGRDLINEHDEELVPKKEP